MSFQLILVHKPIDVFFMKKIFPHALVVSIAHGFNARYLKWADKILCVSYAVKNYLLEKNIYNPIYVLPNSVNLKNTDEHHAKSNEILTIGTLCKFRRKKNIHLLLKTFSALKEQNIAFRGLIAGAGRQKLVIEYYKKKYGLDHCVQILPWQECKESFFRQVDIYCVTSLSETFNLTLIEAMSRKKPVVCTDCGGPSDIITSGEDGLLITNNCELSLTNALKKLLQDESLRKTFSERARDKVQRFFSQEVVLEKFQHFIKKDCSLPLRTQIQ